MDFDLDGFYDLGNCKLIAKRDATREDMEQALRVSDAEVERAQQQHDRLRRLCAGYTDPPN